MKTCASFALAVCFFTGFLEMAPAMSLLPAYGPGITIEGKLNCPLIPTTGGSVYLQISVNTPNLDQPNRKPMNLSVVLDRSGSMADQSKIEFAKKAIYALIDQLSSEDIFSLVIYDDVIEIVKSAGRVENKQQLKRLVERIYPRGSTNLGGGTLEGFRQAEKNLGKEFINRVILLSDGLANQGITDPRELNKIARRYRGRSISLTSIGVGLDYDENLMMGLAENGGGNYYFIESPNSLAFIMNKEFNCMQHIVARNASIELTLGPGVHLRDAVGCEAVQDVNRHTISIGDLYSNDHREFTLELVVPPGTGSLIVASGLLRSEAVHSQLQGTPSFTAVIRYTRDVAEVEKNRDIETQAKADVAASTKRVERALEAFDSGNNEKAAEELHEAKQMLLSSPAATVSGAGASILQDQVRRLDSYEQIIDSSTVDPRKAKKAVQFENYKVQKNKN